MSSSLCQVGLRLAFPTAVSSVGLVSRSVLVASCMDTGESGLSLTGTIPHDARMDAALGLALVLDPSLIFSHLGMKFICQLEGDEDAATAWPEIVAHHEECGWSADAKPTLWDEGSDPDDTWIEEPQEVVEVPAWRREGGDDEEE